MTVNVQSRKFAVLTIGARSSEFAALHAFDMTPVAVLWLTVDTFLCTPDAKNAGSPLPEEQQTGPITQGLANGGPVRGISSTSPSLLRHNNAGPLKAPGASSPT